MHDESNVSATPVCDALLAGRKLDRTGARPLSDLLEETPALCASHPFLPDLAKIEEARHRLRTSPSPIPETVDRLTVNPALTLLPVRWSGLPAFLSDRSSKPEPAAGHVLVLRRPGREAVEVRAADRRDLLALKVVVEGLDPRELAEDFGVPVGSIDDAVHLAVQGGVVLSPPSRIRRPDDFPRGCIASDEVFFSPTFTLQWHITQACDLNCKHCYDRSDRQQASLEQGLGVLDDLYDFCRAHHVFGQVSFTGGNPLMHPDFDRFYAEAARRGFLTAVLGNPSPRRRLESMLSVQKPVFFQVSLEGLEAHNDAIRGEGHYGKTMRFLAMLGDLGVHRVVMLTLTRDNMDQVIPLADHLKDRAELFTFNRLSTVGRGADLDAVLPEHYRSFLADYRKAAAGNPVMGFKDNLFNLLNHGEGRPLTGGCTGHGCGAAFNFVSLLSDGEVHACRKFPSSIGNLYGARLEDIYHGPEAVRYRNGSRACASCDIRPVCGGCLAVVHGAGGDVFTDRDPCCFR